MRYIIVKWYLGGWNAIFPWKEGELIKQSTNRCRSRAVTHLQFCTTNWSKHSDLYKSPPCVPYSSLFVCLTVLTADQMYGPDCPQLHSWGLTSLEQRVKWMERPEMWTKGDSKLRFFKMFFWMILNIFLVCSVLELLDSQFALASVLSRECKLRCHWQKIIFSRV